MFITRLRFAAFFMLTTMMLPAFGATRHGIILSIQPIENRGDDESGLQKQSKKIGGLIGQFVGIQARQSDNKVVSTAGGSAGQAGELIAGKVGPKGRTTRFLVKLRLDSGSVIVATQLRSGIEGFQQGDAVNIEGTGENISLTHAD